MSERDILHGAALAAAELPEPDEGDGAAGRLHLLLRPACLARAGGSGSSLVLGEPPLHDAAREDADEPMPCSHDRDALERRAPPGSGRRPRAACPAPIV